MRPLRRRKEAKPECSHGEGWARSLIYSSVSADRVPLAVLLTCNTCEVRHRYDLSAEDPSASGRSAG